MAQPKKIKVSGRCRERIFGGVAFAWIAGSALAQGIETLPITFDIASAAPPPSATAAAASTQPVLVAAYEAAAPAPRLIRFSTSTGLEAVPNRSGAPKPSVILGAIASGREGDFGIGTLLPNTVAQYAFAYDDLTAREALRGSDPAMFRTLVRQGHIDPPAGQVAVALQKELQRMNCYRSGIDGSWGAGSRRAVTEYFKTRGVSADGLGDQPNAELFRSIVLNGDVACIVAARVDPPKTQTTRRATTTTQRAATRTTTPPKTTAAKPRVAAKPAPSTGPTITGGGVGFLK